MTQPSTLSSRQTVSQLQAQLSFCMQAERPALRRQLQQARTWLEQNKPSDRNRIDQLLAGIAAQMRVSTARVQARMQSLPQPEFADELPVNQKKADIAAAIARHQVVIVCGETGSGKTTQLPKICLELKRGIAGMIGHTQPRRIAARSVAARIASELQSPLGHAVGYKVRFTDKLSGNTYIKLMTDGILLAETQGDRFLDAYDTLIIDEAHERSLNIDFLLGYVKQLLPRRPDLKVIITSATIDAERFSRHFDGAPVIEVSGRTYPVEVRYRPLQETEEDEREEKMEEAILDAVDDLSRLGGGDILVFLPGEREIRDTAEHLRKHHPPGAEILPLFARLSLEDQQRVFRPSGGRRIVLATNVAETSLTVPGVKYVVDSGLARVNRYSPRAKVEQLQIEKISQAAARQRAGRCGRVSNGVCVRLYAEQDFDERPEFTEPEILRSSLASVILRMAALKLGAVDDFPFIEAPSARLVADGYQLLQELGAVDAERRLTNVGSQLAKLPLDPKVGRMLLAAKAENCLTEILIIASALAIQDPRERPMDKREAADRAHARFTDERSDFLGFLKLWEFYDEALKHKKSNRLLVKECHDHFLSFLRLKEWRELHGQLAGIVAEMGFRSNEIPAAYDQVHRALLAGLLGNIGFKDGDSDAYLGARGIKFAISPGSGLKKARPKWIIAAELMETARLYARSVAKIEPDWIEPLAQGLAQSHYSDPRWDRKLAQVSAWERVTLYGLTIVPKRRVHYGPIDPKESREIFIREALAAMEFDTRAPFFEHNRKLIAEVEELEHKARRQDVLVDEHQLFAFYDAMIPAGIVNGSGFEKWRKDAEQDNPRLLYLTREALMRHGAAGVTEAQFPENLALGGTMLPLKYRFEPGHPLDGVTATVPLALLNQLDLTPADWLVPGMVRDKITYLIKALPKTFRRVCVPVPEFVTGFLEQAKPGGKSIIEALAEFVKARTGLAISPADWGGEKIPEHHLMNFRVVDDAGRELAMGRDWRALKTQLGQAAQLTFRDASPGIEREGIKQWDFGDLPRKLDFTRNGQRLTGYPALEDCIDSVAVRLFDIEGAAQASHRAGVRRLMRFELKEQMKQLAKGLPGFTQYALQLRNVMNPDELQEDMLTAIADRAFIGEDELPRSNREFMTQKQRARTRLPAVTEGATRLAQAIAAEYQPLTARLNGLPPPMARLKHEIEEQLGRLLCRNFVSFTPWERLQHLPRYLKALRLRLEKYPAAPERDARHAQGIATLWNRYEQRLEAQNKAGKDTASLQDFRWLIEELRVSLFAQELKTPFPVSVKRLEKIWSELG
ncbi:MAG TPA: ATP-dependent RNA helicase HrpA [Novimethylophilus sp.]|jgi:ATP-dependent helicase HrpA|uniref:ATP-dependent RNA helicase HrpA n=1 Tax=Novimethylophilus sp. TaxID=2137426 RepID=UPI002F41429C